MFQIINRLKSFFTSSLILTLFALPIEAYNKTLKIGAIPDQNQEVLDMRFNLIAEKLSKELKVDVEYIPVINYIAAVTGFRTKDLDLVWFGGLTGVQARLQTPNSIVIAQRDVDKNFKSVFIVNKKLNLDPISNLEELVSLKNLRFTFGSQNSTSGRLMPEYFLNLAGLEIKDFKGGKAGFSGSHNATIVLVNSGAYEAGALNIEIWEKTLKEFPERTKNVEVYWTTPPYADYHWLSQGDLDIRFGNGFTKKLKNFILDLNISDKEDREILELFNANKFINADSTDYVKIEEIARKLKKIK